MKELYRVLELPIFQNKMYETEGEAIACPKGDVVLVQDEESGLIFNRAFDPSLMRYDSSYQNEQAVSSAFVHHLHEVGRIIQRHCSNLDLVEIGCGKGYFLEYLKSIGFRVVGFDPAYEGDNPSIIKSYFGPDSKIKADGIILRHVLEHIADPIEFLLQIQKVAEKSIIYIEVPCFEWICTNRAWFDVYYEHVNYFRIEDFKQMFEKVIDTGHLFGGQYLYVMADMSSFRRPDVRGNLLDFPQDFLKGFHSVAHKAKGMIHNAQVVWGGASRGVLCSLLMRRLGVEIKYVVDINPSKQGKYLAGTGLKVSSPEEVMGLLPDDSVIYIMNSNYTDEVVSFAGSRFQYRRIDDGF